MTDRVVLGIDPSTTATALVSLKLVGKKDFAITARTILYPQQEWTPMRKYEFILSRILKFAINCTPELVVIEDYGFNLRRPGSIIPLVELGGIIRYHLHGKFRYITPKPTVAKQFICGKGNAKKPQVMAAVKSQYGYQPEDDNDADAFVMALIGLGTLCSATLRNAVQHEVIGKV